MNAEVEYLKAEIDLLKHDKESLEDALIVTKNSLIRRLDLAAENARLRELIGRLATTYPFLDHTEDRDICYWCGEWSSNHKPDCPWLEARKVLEER